MEVSKIESNRVFSKEKSLIFDSVSRSCRTSSQIVDFQGKLRDFMQRFEELSKIDPNHGFSKENP